MDNHLKAFLIKFIATFLILFIILGFGYGMAFTEVLLLSIILGTLAYLIGDLFILPRTNNTIGTIADFVMSWAIIYLFIANFTLIDNVFTASLFATIGVTIFEMFFHRYLSRTISRNHRAPMGNFNYQTEIAEELDPEKLRDEIRRN